MNNLNFSFLMRTIILEVSRSSGQEGRGRECLLLLTPPLYTHTHTFRTSPTYYPTLFDSFPILRLSLNPQPGPLLKLRTPSPSHCLVHTYAAVHRHYLFPLFILSIYFTSNVDKQVKFTLYLHKLPKTLVSLSSWSFFNPGPF